MTHYLTHSIFVFLISLLVSPLFSQTEGFAETPDVDIFYQTFGEGEPLVILNGGPGFPSNHFVKLAEKLSNHDRQTIIFDQRGTGQSTLERADAATVTMNKMVEDLEALRRHLAIEKWTVLGHSFGGMYAMYYANKYPDRVKGLVLSHSGGIDLTFLSTFQANMRFRLSPQELDSLSYWSNPENVAKSPKYAPIGRAKAMAPAYVYHREHTEKVVEGMTKLSQFEPQINALVWQDLNRLGFDLQDDLKDFDKEVLIIGGRQDILGESTPYEIHQTLPNSRLELLNECGHYGWHDQPEQYFSIIEDFLESLKTVKMTKK